MTFVSVEEKTRPLGPFITTKEGEEVSVAGIDPQILEKVTIAKDRVSFLQQIAKVAKKMKIRGA